MRESTGLEKMRCFIHCNTFNRSTDLTPAINPSLTEVVTCSCVTVWLGAGHPTSLQSQDPHSSLSQSDLPRFCYTRHLPPHLIFKSGSKKAADTAFLRPICNLSATPMPKAMRDRRDNMGFTMDQIYDEIFFGVRKPGNLHENV